MGYEKTLEVTISRTKHLISFSVGTRAVDLKEMLKNVPDEATVDEILGEGDEFGSIEFHEERRVA
jgi:hypothetical protein